MLRTATVLLTALALTSLFATAQQSSADAATSQIKRDDALHARAEAIVRAEQARAQQPICPHSANNDDYNICVGKVRDAADASETQLVRTLGVLIRTGYQAPKPKPGPLSFDQAEASWHLFRDQICDALGTQYEGGSQQPSFEVVCEITTTRHHIDELWAVFKNVGQ